MEKSLIYLIGETLLLELENAVDITYPTGVDAPKELTLTTDDGIYELTLRKVS
ncbi:MAG: hypothetical protein GX242_06230 [Clostridiales bacterium]|mgnify:CR=1 FL=1|jgi:hypothetical protein|nr:hypothetical protein [Clostridiales bacterium]